MLASGLDFNSEKNDGVLISGADPRTSLGICSEIFFILSNKPGVFGLERATKANIPSTVINNKDYVTREAFDKALHNELMLNQYSNTMLKLCLVSFMRILTPEFVNKWKGKLPKFMGIMVQ